MQCDVCGNEYEHSFEIVRDGETYTFDCFECAIHRLAPTCGHCGCTVIGHGLSADGETFCCEHCVRAATGSEDAPRRTGRSAADYDELDDDFGDDDPQQFEDDDLAHRASADDEGLAAPGSGRRRSAARR